MPAPNLSIIRKFYCSDIASYLLLQPTPECATEAASAEISDTVKCILVFLPLRYGYAD